MTATIDYYFTAASPWAYLGHDRFAAIAKAAGASIRLRPIDLGRIFPISGGLPLPKRAPQRQAYRLVELRRFADHLGRPLHLQPAHFPVAGDLAARLLISVDAEDGTDRAMALAGRIMSGVWADERDIADPTTLGEMLASIGLSKERLEGAQSAAIQERYAAYTQQAIDSGVFGAPTYAVDGELFWGQDRLDFLERRLAQTRV